MFKWTGGKRREIPQFAPLFPRFVRDGGPYRFVEPFAGAGAVFWHLSNPDSHINDFDADVMNFYAQVAAGDAELRATVEEVEKLFGPGKARDAQAAAYYRLRDLDRSPGLDALSPGVRAGRFFVVNQLAFSGMRRFNRDGHFNVPFGHYRGFNGQAVRSDAHARLLVSAELSTGDYWDVLAKEDAPSTFVFLDPPYTRVMKKYSADGEFGEAEQRLLAARLRGLEHASWMLVIDRSELTLELYGDLVRHRYELSYGVNIRNRFDQRSEHIVVTNYTP